MHHFAVLHSLANASHNARPESMSDKARRYAPLWIALLSSFAAVARIAGERFLLEREWKPKPKDFLTAAVGAAFGFLLFRLRRGNQARGYLTR